MYGLCMLYAMVCLGSALWDDKHVNARPGKKSMTSWPWPKVHALSLAKKIPVTWDLKTKGRK